MKVLLVNGRPNEHGCSAEGLKIVAQELRACGVDSETVWLGKQGVRECMACGACKKGLGKCAIGGDPVNDVGARGDEFDGLIVASPVYYAGPTATITAFLDRLFYSAGSKFAYKPGACIVSCRRGGASASFDRLNKYFTINNMPIVSSNYWNQIHGSRAEDVHKDEEGVQTLKLLARNMAWMLKCFAAGKAAGVEMPAPADKVRTNFIRG